MVPGNGCSVFSKLKPVIMSDRHPALLHMVVQVFGKEYHSYCL